MCFLIAPLLFIGFFSPSYSGIVDSENKKSNEHLISLRDYDFVGEDQRLSALLAERMAVLQAPLNLSEPEASGPAPEPLWSRPWVPGPFQSKPDYLHSNVRLPQLVNVSMDYAELINASEVNASLLILVPEPGKTPALGPGGPPPPRTGRAPAPRTDRVPALGTSRAPAPETGRALPDGRRKHEDPSDLDNNKKMLDIMKQCIYSTQRKMSEIEPMVNLYKRDPRFRMAYIYNRLDEWLHDMRTLLHAELKERYYVWRVKRFIWYYEHMLRLNIDITYSVEHLVYLHHEYMLKMEVIMPLNQRVQLKEIIKQKKQSSVMKDKMTLPPSFSG